MSISDTTLLRAASGTMTQELALAPGGGRLGLVPGRLAPAATAHTICGFCSTGCSLEVHLDDRGEAINLTPSPHYPVNQGTACPKGWEALRPLEAKERLTQPMKREADGSLRAISWEEALALFVTRMKAVQAEHGKASLSFLSTGQIATEEMALLGCLAKFGMGMVDVDSNTRQCMATAHVAYKQSFGFDAPPFTYADFEQSDALVFVGANPAIAHPILWRRVMANRRKPDIVVIDPRRTETAMAATLHLPLRPKSDLVLLYALTRELIVRGRVDRAFLDSHTEGFAEYQTFLAPFTLERAAQECDLPLESLEKLAGILERRERLSFWWTMGVNQSHQSTRTAQALINLALITGSIGKPGTGANSITGQCNAMGSRVFGNATSLVGGYDFASEADRAHVARILGVDTECIPHRPSRAYDQILDGIDEGAIRGLWVIATDPAHSWIDQQRIGRLRDKLDFLVVQDLYADTATAELADLLLPAAGWGEKEGTFINSERRIGVMQKVRRAPGQALSDFAIFRLVAEAWGCGEMFRAWSNPEAAFRILRELSRGRPTDFTGIGGYRHLVSSGGIQWPLPESDPTAPRPLSERRLFADGRFFTPNGRARILFDLPRPMDELPDADYPLLLNTGRGSAAQWHTGSRTDRSDVLRKLGPRELVAEINPADARDRGIATGDRVRISSRRGSLAAKALVTATLRPGQLFLPMHDRSVNRLTHPSFDPHSRQPSFKSGCVQVERLVP